MAGSVRSLWKEIDKMIAETPDSGHSKIPTDLSEIDARLAELRELAAEEGSHYCEHAANKLRRFLVASGASRPSISLGDDGTILATWGQSQSTMIGIRFRPRGRGNDTHAY